jgi:hypothetical protein
VVTDAAYARCLYLASRHYENFPVASRLLPKSARPHIAAIYAFARIADDFADEGDRTLAARLALLDDWRDRLSRAAAGSLDEDSSDATAIFTALAATIHRFTLDPQLFHDLLDAFRQDVVTTRYETWDDLLDYCRRSANPVGRLVLRISGYQDARLDRWSDSVCTALQLVNFWIRTSARDACTCRWIWSGEPARTSRICVTGASRRHGPPHWRRPPRARATASIAAGRSPMPCEDDSAGSCARPGSAASAFSIGLPRAASTCSNPGQRSAGRMPRR